MSIFPVKNSVVDSSLVHNLRLRPWQRAMAWTLVSAHIASIPPCVPAAHAQEIAPAAPAVEVTPQEDLRGLEEAKVQQAWERLLARMLENENTDALGAIQAYQGFFESGAFEHPRIAIQIASRIASLYQLERHDYNKAVEIYDWALTRYGKDPASGRLWQERLVALQAAERLGQPVAGHPIRTPPGGAVPPAGVKPLTIKPVQPPEINVPKVKVPQAPVTNALRPAALAIPTARGNAYGWTPGPERSVTALARQDDGVVWVATEDSGLWRCEPTAPVVKRWAQFTAGAGVADDTIYALAVDRLGRLWAGTLNHGVSVWNGQSWRNYGVLDGPLGERVFDIAVCPTDGDVWMATNAGLTRYSVARDSWTHFTRATGLPSNRIRALAFDKEGNLIVGTQCEGLALAQAADGYKSWRLVVGPEQVPVTPRGSGLPSNLINDVLVAHDGTILAATTMGLAWSRDKGANWSYVRGRDYGAKVRDLRGGAPAGWKEESGASLAEDYISCLAEDAQGRLWLGYRQQGDQIIEINSAPSAGIKILEGPEASGLVRAIMPGASTGPLLARYDEGLSLSLLGSSKRLATLPVILGTGGSGDARPEANSQEVPAAVPVSARPSELPRVAGAPSLDELQTLLQIVRGHPMTVAGAPPVVPLPDDWTTQGNWSGRYGRYWANLCAMLAPRDYIWGAGKVPIQYAARIGPNAADDDVRRAWVHWLYTDDKRSLEMPAIYFQSRLARGLAPRVENSNQQRSRRQSEWDDHGEAYPLSKDGPHLNVTLRIPEGLYYLSFFNRNKDGHSGNNRLRDYRISIRPHTNPGQLQDFTGFESRPRFVQDRWSDFWSSSYKRYMVKGPCDLAVQINRNYSHNTTLAGIFVDSISEEPEPYFDTPVADAKVLQWTSAANGGTKEDLAAEELWTALEETKTKDPLWWGSEGHLFYQALARQYLNLQTRAANAQADTIWNRIGTCFYQMHQFEPWENAQEKRGLKTARSIERALEWDKKSDFSGRGRATILAARAKLVDDCPCYGELAQ